MITRRILLALPVVLVGWLATLAVVMRLTDVAPAAFVPFPPASLTANLPAGVAITGASPISLTLARDGGGLTAQLYAAGAWIVLPAGLEACIPTFLRST